MEQKTFHPFPRLPKELRDVIWDFAIRPKRPSAHVFTAFESSVDAEWSQLSQYAVTHPWARRCNLAAPQSRNSTDQQRRLSWVQDNLSAYIIDSGLWRACKESREAVERRFRTAEWDKRRDEMTSQRYWSDPPDCPGVLGFTSKGEQRTCLTYPKSDLYLLQVFNANTLYWRYIARIPIFDRVQRFHVSHFALQFDPGWLTTDYGPGGLYWGTEKPVGCAIQAATDDLDWVDNLWFVDHRIRRRPGAPSSTAKRHEFWGNGCKFTEVRESDNEWEFSHDNDIWEFLDDLGREAKDWVREICGCVENMPSVGVLAYEELGS